MDIRELANLTISLLSALAAGGAAIYARQTLNKQRHILMWSTNYDLLFRTNQMLIDTPDLLALYSVGTDELQRDGISLREFVYIYEHVLAGGSAYQLAKQRRVSLTGARKNFFRSEKVRLVYKKYLRNKLLFESPYTRAIDAYVAELERDLPSIAKV